MKALEYAELLEVVEKVEKLEDDIVDTYTKIKMEGINFDLISHFQGLGSLKKRKD